MSYDTEVAADSPWGYWKTDETSGSTLADSSGNSRPMTVTGSPTLAQTGPGGAADSIAWPSSAASEHYAATTATLSTSAVTFEAWVYLTATPTAQTPIVALGVAYGTGGNDKYLYVGTDGKLRWYIFNAGQVTVVASAAMTLNAWNHIAVSTGAAGTRIRVNKSNVGTSANTGSTTTAAKVFIHGGGIDGTSGNAINATNGSAITIAKAAVYASQLTTTRTDAHYDAMVSSTVSLDRFTSAATFLDVTPIGALEVTPDPFVAAATMLDVTLPNVTNVDNTLDGRQRSGSGTATVTRPVVAPPASMALTQSYDKALAYPDPTMVDGRPT